MLLPPGTHVYPCLSVLAFTANFIQKGDTKVTINSVVLSGDKCPGSHTAELLAEKTKASLKNFRVTYRAVTITTDTAESINKAGTRLLDTRLAPLRGSSDSATVATEPVFNELSAKTTPERHNKMAAHLDESTRSSDKSTTLQKLRTVNTR